MQFSTIRKTAVFALVSLVVTGFAATQTIDDIEWVYSVANGMATVTDFQDNGYTTDVVVPSRLGNCPVACIGSSVFYNCSQVRSVTIPDSVASIDRDAFYNCSALDEVCISDLASWCGISFGNEYANPLYYAGRLVLNGEAIDEELIVPNTATSIGKYAFEKLRLYSVTIPEGVRSIGEAAFKGCSGLFVVTISSSVTNIESEAFSGCFFQSRLSPRITFPGCCSFRRACPDSYQTTSAFVSISPGSTAVAPGAFADCAKLRSITIPDSVENIGNQAFRGCAAVTSIAIPDSVTNIGHEAFSGTGLTSVVIPGGVTSIGEYAFASGATSVEIPDCVTNIGNYAFSGCSGLTLLVSDSRTVSSIWREGRLGAGIESVVISSNSMEIAANAFSGWRGLTSVSIPGTVTNIGANAFAGCPLWSISIPDSVVCVGQDAFYRCTDLQEVYISDLAAWCATSFENAEANPLKEYGVLVLDGEELYRNGELTVPDGVTHIGSYAFANCGYGLTAVSIPNSVTAIGQGAFENCSSVKRLTIPGIFSVPEVFPKSYSSSIYQISFTPGSVEIADGACFPTSSISSMSAPSDPGCANLRFVSIPQGVTNIGSYAFCRCSKIQSIEIPDDVTGVGDYAFFGCSGLTSITIPESVTSIGNYAFYYCAGLTSITIPNGVTTIGCGAFSGCLLESIELPDGLTNIAELAFFNCSKLTSITIPESVTSIGNHAFYFCTGLTSISIPDGVTSIGSSAFRDCSGLTSISIPESLADQADSWSLPECCAVYVRTEGPLDIRETELPVGYVGRGYSASLTPTNEVGAVTFSATGLPSGLSISPDGTISGTSTGCGIHSVSVTATDGREEPVQRSFELVVAADVAWNYRIVDGCAVLGGGTYDSPAVPKETTGIVVIPETLGGCPVTSIGDQAFAWCTELTSISIPEGVLDIGWFAFQECSNLTAITIPSSVTQISPFAFSGCSGLTAIVVDENNPVYDSRNGCNAIIGPKVTFDGFSYGSDMLLVGCVNTVIPDGVTSIGSSAFSGCEGLTSITIPNSVTSIWGRAFVGCSGLTSLMIPDSVRGVWDGAFAYCSGLRSILLPDGLEKIDANLFRGCSNLVSIAIPDSVTNIGESAFLGCSGLVSISIPDGVTSIGESAFVDCSRLASISIPDSVMDCAWGSFAGCTNDLSLTLPAGLAVHDLFGGNEWQLPWITNVVLTAGSTSIGGSAFEGCSGLRSITIPDGVTNIGWSAFASCENLSSITIPNGVTHIGWAAFGGCSGLKSIVIPDGVECIIDDAFRGCTSLKRLTIPGEYGLGEIDSWSVFREPQETHVGEIVVTPGSQKIGNHAFSNFSSCTNIAIPDSVTSIEFGAFSGCSSLSSISIPSGVTNIGWYAFESCENLSSITIPNGVTHIGWAAFRGCSGLKSIAIPDSVTSIESEAFSWCYSLPSITFPSSVTNIGNSVLSESSGLSAVFLPDSLLGRADEIGVPEGCGVFFYGTSVHWIGLGFHPEWAFSEDATSSVGFSLRSKDTAAGETALIEATVAGAGTLTFDWRVSTFARRHYARFYADDVRERQITGETEWATETIVLGDGPHALKWTYEKSAAATSGDDAAFLDNVHWSPLTLDEALDATNLVWTTDAASPWIPQIAETADGVDAAKSGAVSGEATSDLATTVDGPGELSWKWKARIDGLAGVDVWLDGKMLPEPYLNETADWTDATLDIEGDGPHRVEFRFWNGGTVLSDCACVDLVSWTTAKPASIVVEGVEIPVAWLETNAPAALAAAGGDFEAAARATAANGADKVWQCYLSGVSPTNAAERFEARIAFENGEPVVTWTPDLGDARDYVVLGKTNLVDRSWGPTNESTRFFRVKVEMP